MHAGLRFLGLLFSVCFWGHTCLAGVSPSPSPTSWPVPIESSLLAGAISDTGFRAQWAFQGKHQSNWADYGNEQQLVVLGHMRILVRGFCWGPAKAGRLTWGPGASEYFDFDPRATRFHTAELEMSQGTDITIRCWRGLDRSVAPDSQQRVSVTVLINDEIALALAVFRDYNMVQSFDFMPDYIEVKRGDQVCVQDIGFPDPYRSLNAVGLAAGVWSRVNLSGYVGGDMDGFQCLEIPNQFQGGIQLPGEPLPVGLNRIRVRAKVFQSHLMPRLDQLIRIRVLP